MIVRATDGPACALVRAHRPGDRSPHWQTLVAGRGFVPTETLSQHCPVRVLERGQYVKVS